MTTTTKILLAFFGSAVVAGGAYYIWSLYNPTLPSDTGSGGGTTYTLSNGVQYTISAPNYTGGTEASVQSELTSAGFTNISFTSFNPPDAAGYTCTATWNGPDGATLQMADSADTVAPVPYTAPTA